ncbi:Hypothetical_protein [Hexamita inflata]|uniref:Hypothetical_protein n=1 Tax=Hexamita inflata TaxID=28002 RepID=A0ABP1KFF5_9EUKA
MDVNEYKWKLTDVMNWIQKEYKGHAKLMYGKTEKASARGEGKIKISKLPKLNETKVQNERIVCTEDIPKPEQIAIKNLHHVICTTLIAAFTRAATFIRFRSARIQFLTTQIIRILRLRSHVSRRSRRVTG